MFMEASALTGENVEEAFLKCAKSILAKIETGGSLLILDLLISSISLYLEGTDTCLLQDSLYSVFSFLNGCCSCNVILLHDVSHYPVQK